MSVSGDEFDELRRQFNAGELTLDEFEAALNDIDEDTTRDELFLRWSSQGLLDQPITVEGYTSFAGNRITEVDPDG